MSLIYTPAGAAREYSPLALNVYTGGCDHGCKYCYCMGVARGNWGKTPVPRNLDGLDAAAARSDRQILLSFMADPYCLAELTEKNTQRALLVLAAKRCSVAILTKGIKRSLCDFELFCTWPDRRIKVGTTLTFLSAALSREHEPFADEPRDRIKALQFLHESGVRTWASIEPVIIASESLAIIEASLPFVDEYRVGKLNHRRSNVDWADFGRRAVEMIRGAGKGLYVKAALRAHLPEGFLTDDECDMDAFELPRRKE